MFLKIANRFSSNLKSFNKLEELNGYLEHNKFTMTVVYFRANWNPNCAQADKEAERLAANYGGLQVIKIDSDVAPKIAKHYGVKAEPQFVFCLYGDQVLRQLGPNYEKLEQKHQSMIQLSQHPDFSFITEKWQPYGLRYKAYYEKRCKQSYEANVSDI